MASADGAGVNAFATGDSIFTEEMLDKILDSAEGRALLLDFCRAKSFSKEEETAREKLRALCAKFG